MSTELNNNLFMSTAKSADIIEVKRYIVDKINSSQKIRRYCRWLTKTPLSKSGIDYTGEIINQKELGNEYQLIEEVSEKNKEKGLSSKRILIPYSFNEDLVNEEQLFIFVYPYSNNFSGTLSNDIFAVSIMTPLGYNEISPYGDERLYKIVYEIIDLFDEKSVEETEWIDKIGNIQFEIQGTVYPYRLTKTKNMLVYPLLIRTKTSNVRY